jgi:hypothetical protein
LKVGIANALFQLTLDVCHGTQGLVTREDRKWLAKASRRRA